MKIAAAYIRVSTDDQLEFSPDSQLKNIQAYAKDNDMILPQEYIFVDEGISGRSTKNRAGFLHMISVAKSKPKPFDVILVWKFSRFARNRTDSNVYKSMLRKDCDIDVISISEPLNDDISSVILEAVYEAMDEYYSLNLSQEVKRGMTEKFSRGGVVSQPPFGYTMKDGIFVPDEEKAPIVKMIYTDFLKGSKTRQIAIKLNNMGIKTTKGNKFGNRTIEYILTNATYTGKMRRRVNPKEKRGYCLINVEMKYSQGKHEPIIGEDIFNKVQEIIKERKAIYHKWAHSADSGVYHFLLKGLVRCDNCGSTLVMQSGAAKYLQCHSYARGSCKISHSISLDKITNAVLKKIRDDIESDSFLIDYYTAKVLPTKSVTKPIESLLQKEYAKLERIKEAFITGLYTAEECREMKLKINETIKSLKSELIKEQPSSLNIKSFKTEVSSVLTLIDNETVSMEEKNLAMRKIVKEIIFYKPRNNVEIIYNL